MSFKSEINQCDLISFNSYRDSTEAKNEVYTGPGRLSCLDFCMVVDKVNVTYLDIHCFYCLN